MSRTQWIQIFFMIVMILAVYSYLRKGGKYYDHIPNHSIYSYPYPWSDRKNLLPQEIRRDEEVDSDVSRDGGEE